MNRLAMLGAYRLSVYLKDHDCGEAFDDFPGILDRDAKREKVEELNEVLIFNGSDEKDRRIRKLLHVCGDNRIAVVMLELAALRLADDRSDRLMLTLATGGDGFVTPEAASKICGFGTVFECEQLLRDAYRRLSPYLSAVPDGENIPRKKLYIDDILENYLSGGMEIPEEYAGYMRYYEAGDKVPVLYGFEEKFTDFGYRLQAYMDHLEEEDDSECLSVFISGEHESGRTTALKCAAGILGMGVVTLDADFVSHCKPEDRKKVVSDLVRFCLLYDLLPGIYDVKRPSSEKGEPPEKLIGDICRLCAHLGNRPLFFICESGVKALPTAKGHVMSLEIPACDDAASYAIWNGMLSEAGLDKNIDADELASKMKLTAGQIKRVIELIKTENISTASELTTHDVYRLCYRVLDDGRYENIRRVDSSFSIEDVKTGEFNQKLLREICDQVKNRRKVYTEWGMKKKYEYGRCVSCILSGPPGTGKTMAVRALSSELGLELYKVDLSQIVDKYIGETEKRLEEVFTRAERSNMILFFDEADAIMGRRTETSDSKDRYANTEIAYILQRIEEYDGIVLLATNYIQNIDPAFMRRIRYVINFEIPDEETRLKLWHSGFAPEVPLSDGIDWEYLAEYFKLSGGSIKNITLNATFLAAAENEAVGMKHIIRAMMRENNKDKRVSFISDYGKYGHLAR